MAITRDQVSTLGQSGSATTVTTSWSTNPTAGVTVLVFVQCTQVPTSVVDNGTSQSAFTRDVSTTLGKGAHVYRANNISLPASGSYTVTVTTATAATIQTGGVSYLGVNPGAPTATQNGSGTSTSVSSGSAGPAAASGLVFGGFSDASGLNPETITYTGPGTQQFVDTNGSAFWPMAAADDLTGSAQTLTWTLGDSVAWAAVIAAYDAVGGGAAAGPQMPTQQAHSRSQPQQVIPSLLVPPATGVIRGQVSTFAEVPNNASVSTSWAGNPQAGNTILVWVSLDVPFTCVDNGVVPSTFTDDSGTFLGHGSHVMRANNITLPASGQYTVTVTPLSGTHTILVQGIEYYNVQPGPPQSASQGSNTDTAPNSGSVTGVPGSLYFGGFSDKSTLNPETITFNSSPPFTQFLLATNGSGFWPGAAADAIIAGGGSQSLSWTLGDSIIWGSSIASYAPT
jgi:hypothetical protein